MSSSQPNKITTKQGHVVYLDILRVVAILAVVPAHIAVVHFANTDVFSTTWDISNIWNCLCRWSVPVFVMISGALFLDPTREISFHKLYSQNICRIGRVLIFWSIAYALLDFITGPFQGNKRILITHIITGHFHLWFLYMLLGLYCIVPLLRPICKDMKLVRYFLVLSLFFSFLVPSIVKFLTGLTLIAPHPILSETLKTINILFDYRFYFHFTLGYVAYFVLGHYMHQVLLQSKQRKFIYALGILGWTFSIVFTRIVSHTIHGSFDFYTGGDGTLWALFESLAIFVFVKQHAHLLSSKLIAVFHSFSKYVLGIYVIHMGVRDCLSKIFDIYSTDFNPLFSIPLLALLILCWSWIGTEIIKRIPWLEKRIL